MQLISRKYEDAEVQFDIKHFRFKVLNNTGKTYVHVNYRGEDKEFVCVCVCVYVVVLQPRAIFT